MPTKPTGRPRGRPPGVKNKPKTIEEFVQVELTAPPPKPPRAKKAAARGPWAHMTPEERKAYSQKLNAAPRKGPPPNTQTPGKPRDLTNAQWAEVQEIARLDAKRIMQKMKDAGQVPDDPRAAEALEKTVETLRTAESAKDKIAAARLILDFTKAKPAQKTEVTVRTAEDILDEMAEDDDR